jgi:hypothetical protein
MLLTYSTPEIYHAVTSFSNMEKGADQRLPTAFEALLIKWL